MKRWLLILTLWAGSYALGYASSDNSLTFDPQTGTILVSSIPASPTQIFIQGPYGFTRSYVINPSAFNLYVSTFSTSMSTTPAAGTVGNTTNTFYIAPGATYSPDGIVQAYQGPLYGVLASTAAVGTAPTPQAIIRNRIR